MSGWSLVERWATRAERDIVVVVRGFDIVS